MCGRFSLGVDTDRLVAEFGLSELAAEHRPRFNIAPTQPVAAVVAGPNGLRLGMLRWGLIPAGSDAPPRAPLINARSETVDRRPSFASSFRHRRCWILADGFYEWRREPDGSRSPYHIRLPDGRPFALAGLWDRWQSDDAPVLTCAILTTRPAAGIAHIHDRMPAILAPDTRAAWLDGSTEPSALRRLLEPWDGPLLIERVSTRVNSVINDDPGCLTPAEDPAEAPAETSRS